MKAYIPLLLLALLLVPVFTGANTVNLNLDYPTFGGFNIEDNQDLTAIIAWFYYLIVGISGLAAFVMIVWGGVQWMTSAGNASQMTDAKDKIQKALLGLLLILVSFLILQVINPELIQLQPI